MRLAIGMLLFVCSLAQATSTPPPPPPVAPAAPAVLTAPAWYFLLIGPLPIAGFVFQHCCMNRSDR